MRSDSITHVNGISTAQPSFKKRARVSTRGSAGPTFSSPTQTAFSGRMLSGENVTVLCFVRPEPCVLSLS